MRKYLVAVGTGPGNKVSVAQDQKVARKHSGSVACGKHFQEPGCECIRQPDADPDVSTFQTPPLEEDAPDEENSGGGFTAGVGGQGRHRPADVSRAARVAHRMERVPKGAGLVATTRESFLDAEDPESEATAAWLAFEAANLGTHEVKPPRLRPRK